MQRANIALALAATLAAGCNEAQELLGDIVQHHGSGHHHGGGHGGGPTPPPAPSCGPSVTSDDLFALIAVDLSRLDADDQPFQRYVTLANQFNAGTCGSALDPSRLAVVELFNTLSGNAALSQPVAIDADELTFRVDLRDYDWDREIEVDGRTFSDGWEAAIAGSPFAIEYGGDDADDAKADSGTTVPIMSFDALADVTSESSLYYALVGVPATSEALYLDSLAIDVDANRRDGESVLAGTTRSLISRANRLFDRNEIEVRAGFIWRALDSFTESGIDFFADPLTLDNDGSVTLFTLPNGLLGFAIFDAEGNRIDDSDILLDTNQNNFRAKVAASCLNCHGSTGLLPVEDEVRAFVEANADDFDAATVAAVERLYPPQSELDGIIARDSSAYTATRVRAGIDTPGGDALGNALLAFDRDVDTAAMAGDLFVSQQDFVNNLNLLPPNLSAPFTDRGDYASAYAEAVCILGSVNENVPVDCN